MMSHHPRGWIVGSAALGLCLSSLAADDKDLLDEVKKVASAFEKQDEAAAKKAALEIGKTADLEDVMYLFKRPRTKGGIGVGSEAGAVTPDAVEKKLVELAKKPLPDKQLADESKALTEMGYAIAALGEVACAMAPDKDDGKKKKRDWIAWSQDLRDASLRLASAAKDKNAAGLHKAAKKADDTCTRCHDVFK